MPSGSHRTSRGSHSSGGSRSSGSGSRGRISSGGSHYRGPTHHYGSGPRRYYGRRTVIYHSRGGNEISVSPLTGLLIILAFLMIFLGFFQTASLGEDKQYLELIEEDYAYYQDMIDYANENNEYIVDAIVTDKFLNEVADRYYITYKIDLGNGEWLNAQTYACYTLEEARDFRVNQVIKVAVNSIPVTKSSDSITMDYEDMPLTRDGEYLLTTSEVKKHTILMWVFFSIGIGSGVILVFRAIKGKSTQEESAPQVSEPVKENSDTQCAYCGATYSKNARKCPGCGSTIRKR